MAGRRNEQFNRPEGSSGRPGYDGKRPAPRVPASYPGHDFNWTHSASSSASSGGHQQPCYGAQSSTPYGQHKSTDQSPRALNGYAASSYSQQQSNQTPLSRPDSNVETTAKHIQNIWALWKQSNILSNSLTGFFETSSNPYVSLLELTSILSEDRSKSKANSMIHTIMNEFYKWIKPNEEKYEPFLTDQLKTQAFKMILDKRICQNSMSILVNIFNCNSRLDIMEELIRESIKQKRFKEACYASMSLNIQDRFTVEDFLVPLFFVTMISVTQEFLVSSKFQQIALVKYFDNMLLENDDCLYQLANRLNIAPVNNNFSNKSHIKTYLTKMMKKYKIPNEYAPNLTKIKRKGALKFMFHRYQSGVTGVDGWREMVLESVENDEDMMLEVIRMLDSYGDLQECIYFARSFAIEPSLLPPNIQQELLFSENASASLEKPNEEDYATNVYHQLSLPYKQIHIIDCVSKFDEFLEKINIQLFDAHLDVFGLDCEWKPELTSDKSDLASIQLATIDTIYIFHLPQLQPTDDFKLHWQEFAMNIFSNINILKLGFEWKGDASMISSTLPIDNVQLHGPGFVDMKLLWKELETQWNFQLPYQDPNDGIAYNSLSDLVKLCFGKPLNKTEQFSNWEKVPLRSNQIKYAALDAYCLLEIYNLFKAECKSCNIPFDEVCHKITNSHQPETKPKPRHKKHKHKLPRTNMETNSPHTNVSSVKDFKFLLPNTLEKLAERLRKCGIDSTLVERSKINDSQYIVNLIKTNRLHFIAFGHAFSKVADQLSVGQSYCVLSHNLDDQLQEVLNYFKIVVQKEDLNSRCQCCNSDRYEIVTNTAMKTIYDTVKSNQNQPVVRYRPPSVSEEYDDYYFDEDDYSEDEGTSAPLVTSTSQPFANEYFSSTRPEDQNTKFLNGLTDENVEINIKPLQPEIFIDKNRMFIICNSCGSVSWDNSHWESALGSSVGMKYK